MPTVTVIFTPGTGIKCNPDPVPVNERNATIRFIRGGQPNWRFHSFSVEDPDRQFGPPNVADAEITVSDKNSVSRTYKYTIGILPQGATQPEELDPRIVNNSPG